MKKTVLAIASLLLTSVAAQAQWVQQPFTFANNYLSAYYLDAVDANVVWTAGFDVVDEEGGKQVAFTTNGGTSWTVSTISNLAAAEEITGIAGISATTALVCTTNGAGGRILKTVDGGLTWTAQTVAGQFTSADSFPNYIAFFNATEGICAGDPVPATGRFEVYRTTDAGATWTAVPAASLPAATTGEYSVVNHFATVGNGFWFSTTEGRVFGTVDKGVTWTVGNTGLGATTPWVSFRDASNGLALTLAGTLARTTNGGATWQSVAPTGTLHAAGIDNVPGTNQYVTVGYGSDAGSSYSRDNGATWVSIEATRNHASLDFISPTVGWSSALNATDGSGIGAYKLSTSVLGTTQNVALQQGLSVYPNPSADGQFTVAMAQGRPAETQVTVFDALGRNVYARTVQTATAPSFTLDLSRQALGIYTLQLRTEGGVAQQKLVIK